VYLPADAAVTRGGGGEGVRPRHWRHEPAVADSQGTVDVAVVVDPSVPAWVAAGSGDAGRSRGRRRQRRTAVQAMSTAMIRAAAADDDA